MALNIENIVAELKEATILELNDLVKAIEEEFGVTAAAPVAVAAAGGAEGTVRLFDAGRHRRFSFPLRRLFIAGCHAGAAAPAGQRVYLLCRCCTGA